MSNCICSTLTWALSSDEEMSASMDKRHHPACPLFTTEVVPRLFYYEEAIEAWTPTPNNLDGVIELYNFSHDGEEIEIRFKRHDMTDEQFYNLPEA